MKGTRISFRTGGKHRRLPFTEQRDPFFKATALRRRRWPKVTGILVAAAIVVGGAVVWQVHHSGQARIRAALERTATGYLSAWGHRDVASMKRLVQPPVPKAFSALNQELFDGLRVGTAAFTAGSIGDPGASSQAIVPFTARLELLGLGTWTYHGRLTLGRAGDLWRVRWTPATVYPGLTPSLALARTRSWPQRAPILARDGNPLTIQGDVVTIGVVPGHIQSRHEVFDALQRYTGVDPAEVKAAIDAPGVKPNWFVPVITLRRQRYEQVRAKLYPVPGIFFHEGRGRILIQEGFAQQVVGRVGDVTAEELKRLGQPYEAGDIVGQYGLEEAFERQLAGRPGGTIELRKGKKVVRTLARFGAIDPKPLQTTLDIDTQRAAENALSSVGGQVALVALDARTGEIRAVANRPASGANTAFEGHYPPGSTFKVVTGAALLAHGWHLDSPITCPTTVNAGGKVFKNFEGEALGSTDFIQAFAHSCNTAFIQMALKLSASAIPSMAATLGFGAKYSFPVPLAVSQFPKPVDDADRAASAIGQGRDLATPLQMATVAAAADTGVWHAPVLVAGQAGPSHRLPKGVSANLTKAMRLVVTEGTGTAANIPGQDVHGKTGTAEFGTSGQTHAWFIGFRGNLAFAVIVPGGGVGGEVAAPIAARFLRNL